MSQGQRGLFASQDLQSLSRSTGNCRESVVDDDHAMQRVALDRLFLGNVKAGRLD